MKDKMILVAAAILFVLSACASPTAQWQTYSSQEGGFSILAPGTFKEQVQSTDTAAGKMELHQLTLDQGTVGYFVMYADFPEALIQLSDPKALLQDGVEGAAKAMNAMLTVNKDITLDGVPGKEFQGEIALGGVFAKGGIFKARAFLSKNRLYQIYAAAEQDKVQAAEVDKYLASFKFLTPAGSMAPSAPQASNVQRNVSPTRPNTAPVGAIQPTNVPTIATAAPTKQNTATDTTHASALATPGSPSVASPKYDTDLPLPPTVQNFTGGGKDQEINFQTPLSLSEAVAFYRQTLTQRNLSEWTEATRITDTTFNLVFRGASNGQALVVQGVTFGTVTNVNIHFESL